MDRWGLDWATLQRSNPRPVLLRLTGLARPALCRQARVRAHLRSDERLAHLTGEAGRHPLHITSDRRFDCRPLRRLRDREPGGRAGARTERPRPRGDLFGHRSTAACAGAARRGNMTSDEVRGRTAHARATRRFQHLPHPCDCGSRWWALGCDLRRLCAAMGTPALCEEPRFATTRSACATSTRSTGSRALVCRERLRDAERAAGSVRRAVQQDLLDRRRAGRPALSRSGRPSWRLPDPELGSLPAPASVPRFGGYEPPPPRTGPATGEHNASIYGALGLTAPTWQRCVQPTSSEEHHHILDPKAFRRLLASVHQQVREKMIPPRASSSARRSACRPGGRPGPNAFSAGPSRGLRRRGMTTEELALAA